jgi:hypothetical protein
MAGPGLAFPAGPAIMTSNVFFRRLEKTPT